MTLGGSLVLIAIGAILKFAVTAEISGIDVGTVGVVLMVIGVIGFVISVIWLTNQRRRPTTTAVTEQRRYADPVVEERTYRAAPTERVTERRTTSSEDPYDPRL